MELLFIQTLLPNAEFLPLLTGNGDNSSGLEAIKNHLENHRLLVVSTDWSHFYRYREAVQLDQNSISLVVDGDIPEFEHQGIACGKTAVLLGMQIARKREWEGELLKYMNSGDVNGDHRSVVGYAAMAFWV